MEVRDRRVTTEDMAALGERRRPILDNAERSNSHDEIRAEEARDRRDMRENEARRMDEAHNEARNIDAARSEEARRTEDGSTMEVRPNSRPMNGEEKLSPLLAGNEESEMRSRWHGIQASFVDEPRRAVEQADELVAETMQRLAQSFAEQKKNLETQWGRSDQVSTEDLRMAFRRYRSFFDRLLSL